VTRHTVGWVQSVENELAEIWLAADDRNEITIATHWIDSHLSTNADVQGEALAAGLRSLNIPPLRLIFTLQADDPMVEVVRGTRIRGDPMDAVRLGSIQTTFLASIPIRNVSMISSTS